MDGPIEIGQVSKSDRERQTPYDFTYMWNAENNSNETRKKELQTQRTNSCC